AIDLERAADKIVTTALALPKSVARYYHRHVRVRFAVFDVIEPSAKWLDTHQREVVFRREERKTAPHLVIASDTGHRELERGKIDEQTIAVLTQLAIFIVGELPVIVVGILAAVENVHNFPRSQRDHR